jgi:hypothetical protein
MTRTAVLAVLGFRIAYGLALIVAPARLTKSWLGSVSENGGTQVAVRALGAREVLLHTGAVLAAVNDKPVRPWLLASMAGDLTDVAATAAARADVPDDAPAKTAAVAGGSALLSGALAAIVDD